MIIALPSDWDLCIAPELAILAAIETSLMVAVQVLNIAHAEIFTPSTPRTEPSPDCRLAADIIAQASALVATISRYRLALLDPDADPA